MSTRKNLPKEWCEAKLGECLLQKPDYGINAPSVEYSESLPLYLRITDISEEGHFLHTKKTSVDHVDSKGYFLDEGDIVFVRTGASVGKTYLYDKKDGDLVFAGFLIRIKVNANKISPSFLSQYTRSDTYNQWVKEISVRSGQPGINGNEYSNLELLLPSVVEQQRIVTVLETWDQAIGKLKRKIEIKKEINSGLSQKLLAGKSRLSGFSMPWNQVRISSFSKPISKLNTDNSCTEVLSCTKYDGLVRSLEYFDRKVYGSNLTKYKVVPKGYFAYATNHIEEGSIGYQDLVDAGLVSPMYTVFKTEGVNNNFLYKLLKTPKLISEYRRHMSASVERRGGLRWPPFSSIKVSLPSVEEQDAISALIQTSENEICSLERKLKYIAEQKTYLLNSLTTGTIRTPETLSVNA